MKAVRGAWAENDDDIGPVCQSLTPDEVRVVLDLCAHYADGYNSCLWTFSLDEPVLDKLLKDNGVTRFGQ